MQTNHYLNLVDADLDKPVYRIVSVHRLLESLRTNRLVLVHPSKWDDPFENMMLSSSVTLESFPDDPARPLRGMGYDAVYGQCWTFHRETDAMWRIYSSDKAGAKIRSTPRKLLKALQIADLFDQYSYVGRVLYKNRGELRRAIGNLDIFASDGSGVAMSLMFKRPEFSHEQELRLVFAGPVSAPDDLFPLPIDPNNLFEEVVLDPRLDIDAYRTSRASLRNEGFRGPIRQSTLYRPPRQLVVRYPI
jgi:hypothetical protein